MADEPRPKRPWSAQRWQQPGKEECGPELTLLCTVTQLKDWWLRVPKSSAKPIGPDPELKSAQN